MNPGVHGQVGCTVGKILVLQPAHAVVHFKRRLGRMAAVMLGGLRVSENRLQPVAMELIDDSTPAGDGGPEGLTHVGQKLGVDLDFQRSSKLL